MYLSQESEKLYRCLIIHDSDNNKMTTDEAIMSSMITEQSSELSILKSDLVCTLANFEISFCLIQSPPFAYTPSCTRLLLFGMFELAISKPLKEEKIYIPQKKALLPIV